MKLTGKPIYPADLAPTAKVTAAETAIAKLDTDYKAADKTLGDKNTTQDTAIAAVKTTADKAATDITALTTTVTNNKAAADAGISSAIAEWDKDRPYKVNNIVMRNKTFFLCSIDNTNRDPLTDKTGAWGIFTPGSASDIFANRSPTSVDVHPAGVKWWDVSFGADSPLGFVSLSGGAWQFLNQISLSKIRFFGYGINSTYQSNLNSIKFLKADGTQIANGWFVWGASSGLGKPQAGTAFNNQNITGQYNASGWCDLEPSHLFDLSVNIAKITASSGYFTFTKLQFIYSNGGIKTFTALGDLSPVPQSRYGDSIASVLGQTLTAAQLANANSLEAGRLTGSEFTAAFNQLYQSQPQVLAGYQQETIDALTARIAALENRTP